VLDKIKAAWRYSKTIFLNVVCGVTMLAGELLQFAIGFDWTAVVGTRTAGLIVLGVNMANIALRYTTTRPVGEK
jgi:hypothetical protein